jgi:hypothetical protein
MCQQFTVGVEEHLAFSLFHQFTVELRIHFSFLCSRESAKVEQIFQWKPARYDEMLSTEFSKCRVSNRELYSCGFL